MVKTRSKSTSKQYQSDSVKGQDKAYEKSSPKSYIKAFIKLLIPSKVREFIRSKKYEALIKYGHFLIEPDLISNYIYDYKRFGKWSSTRGKSDSKVKLQAEITMDYHRVEKGLSLREPRLNFGAKVIKRLLANLKSYIALYGTDKTVEIAVNSLNEYCNFNAQGGREDQQVRLRVEELKGYTLNHESSSEGGTVKISKSQIQSMSKLDTKSFFESRHSIRQFSDENVEMSLIEKAVLLAQKTPSVCNRQSSKVYVFSEEADKARVLSCQNGNRGFSEQINKVLIVTSDVQHFVSIGERNQGWIDGGMFSMSLIYALHSMGVGTCCLNWSAKSGQDRLLREASGIPDSEIIIMLIAVGHLPEELKIAQSPRKDLQEVLVVK